MTTQEATATQMQIMTIEQRRMFLSLPIEQRRRLMNEQAARMIEHYNLEQETKDREEWQGGTLLNSSPQSPKRGEIWQVNLDPTVGAEIQKSRPAIVISSDAVGAFANKACRADY